MKLTRRFACLLVFGMFVTLPPELTFTSGQTSPQVFYGSRITISVRASKHFISGAQVTISRIISINPLNMKTISGKTNRYGEYSVSGLNLGTYSIHVEVNGYSPQVTEVLVGPGLFSHVYTYEMIANQSVMGVITGRVLNALGKGISKAEVNIVQKNTGMEFVIVSDTEGNYEQTALVPGKYALTVKATDYRSAGKTVRMADRQILKQDFKLKRR